MSETSILMADALRLLSGQEGAARRTEGIDLLERASGAGEPDASALLAALCAMGVGAPPDVNRALDLLIRAAEQGSTKAQNQLRVLAVDEVEGGAGDRRRLAAAAAAAAVEGSWLSPPRKQPLCETPRIRLLPGFLPPAACAWMIGIGRHRAVPAQVYDAQTGASRSTRTRSNSAFELGLADLDMVTVLVRRKIAALAGVPSGALEATQILHYAQGQRFERHYDYLDVAEPGYAREAAEHGQRIATVLVYLNADYEGGATEFSCVDISVKGAVGDGLMFANVDRAGAPDPLTLHRGAPPTSGEKWLLSQWIRDKVPAR